MRARLSKISLTVFAVMVVLAAGAIQLSVPGNNWPWFATVTPFTVLPIIIGPRLYRVAGVAGLAVAVALIGGDLQAGKLYRQKMRSKLPPTHENGATGVNTNQPGQPAASQTNKQVDTGPAAKI